MSIKEGEIILDGVTVENLGKIEAFLCGEENCRSKEPILSLDILKGGQKKGGKVAYLEFDIALKIKGPITVNDLRIILTKIV